MYLGTSYPPQDVETETTDEAIEIEIELDVDLHTMTRPSSRSRQRSGSSSQNSSSRTRSRSTPPKAPLCPTSRTTTSDTSTPFRASYLELNRLRYGQSMIDKDERRDPCVSVEQSKQSHSGRTTTTIRDHRSSSRKKSRRNRPPTDPKSILSHTSSQSPSFRDYKHNVRSVSAPRLRSKSRRASPRINRSEDSSLSPEQERGDTATATTMRDAEREMDGILMTLADMQFLDEIDREGEAAAAAEAKQLMDAIEDEYHDDDDMEPPPQPRSRVRSQSVPRPPRSALSGDDFDAIPTVVRAVSPPRDKATGQRRLPPPPSDEEWCGLNPRKVSKLDRITLELETQRLCLEVVCLKKNKRAHDVAIMDHAQQTRKISELESTLNSVRNELDDAKNETNVVREQVQSEYEERLAEHVHKLQQTQALADQYQHERHAMQVALEEWEREHNDEVYEVTDFADELRMNLEAETKTVHDLRSQLDLRSVDRDTEVTKLREELSITIEKFKEEIVHQHIVWHEEVARKDKDLLECRDNLKKTAEQLEEFKIETIEEYEAQILVLKEQVLSIRKKKEKAELEWEELSQAAKAQRTLIQEYKQQFSQHEKQAKQLTRQIDAAQMKYRSKFEKVKHMFESKMKLRIQEMVDLRSEERREYERRLLVLQQQLKFQNDQHQESMEQKERHVHDRIEAYKQTLEQEIHDDLENASLVADERVCASAKTSESVTSMNTRKVDVKSRELECIEPIHLGEEYHNEEATVSLSSIGDTVSLVQHETESVDLGSMPDRQSLYTFDMQQREYPTFDPAEPSESGSRKATDSIRSATDVRELQQRIDDSIEKSITGASTTGSVVSSSHSSVVLPPGLQPAVNELLNTLLLEASPPQQCYDDRCGNGRTKGGMFTTQQQQDDSDDVVSVDAEVAN